MTMSYGADTVRLDGRSILLVRQAVATAYDLDSLEQDLYGIGRQLSDLSPADTLPNVAYRVLRAAENEGWLADLLEMLRASRFPAVREIATRMLADATVAATGAARTPPAGGGATADPYRSHLVGELLFIDRTPLRAHVKDLLSDTPSRVLVVTGARPCGKSYTWHYVQHLAGHLADITPVLVDLGEWVEPSRPMELMTSIALQLRLPPPTVDEHAQSAAQVQSLRDWLVGQLLDREGRWLFVFDSLDHVAQREETLQLIEYLAGAAIRRRLTGLRVVLLGYADRLPIDPLESVLTEEIGDIGEPELREFFQTLALGAQLTLTDQALDHAVRGVLDLLPRERDRKLRELSRTVRAVGNAAFGTRVLP